MLETVLRRLSRFNPSERIAALHRKLNRLEADLHSMEQELRSSGLFTTEADFPFQEMQAGLGGIRAGLETVAAHADSFPGLRKLLATINRKVDRMASRTEEIRARFHQRRPPQA